MSIGLDKASLDHILTTLGRGTTIDELIANDGSLTREHVQSILSFVATDKEFRREWASRGVEYKKVWNVIAADSDSARRMVDGSDSEDAARKLVQPLVALLLRAIDLRRSDTVLEIGCGIGRVGAELLEKVHHWVGVDVSDNMLKIARGRLEGIGNNFTLVTTQGADLASIRDRSVDRVYSHAVFMHMDKEDFFSYLVEAARVLRVSGLFYFDVWNLCDTHGFKRFRWEKASYSSREERPAHRNQFHSPDEVRSMVAEAGLRLIAMNSNCQIQCVAAVDNGFESNGSQFRHWLARHPEVASWTEEEVDGFRKSIDAM